MNWKQWFILAVFFAVIICTVALQIEKPSILLEELRPQRAATHFRAVAFAPGTDTAWAAGFNGHISHSSNAGASWDNQDSTTHAHLYGIHVNSVQKVWACGSNGTLIKTENGGKKWERVPLDTQLRLLDICFMNSVTGFAAGDNGLIIRTRNGGNSWKILDTGFSSGFRHIWGSGKNVYAAGYEGVLIRSDDLGNTWKQVETPEHISFYGVHSEADGSFYLAGSCGTILKQSAGSDAVEILPIVTTNFLRDITFNSAGYGAAAGYGLILWFNPETRQWSKGQVMPNRYLQGIALNDEGRGIAVGRWGTIYISDDNGRTWNWLPEFFSPDMNAVAINHNGAAVSCGADGWTFTKSADANQWIPEFSGLPHTLNAAESDNLGRFWCAGRVGTAFFRPSNGHWQHKQLPVQNDLNDIWFGENGEGYIAGDRGVLLHTVDNGDNWKSIPSPTTNDLYCVDFLNENHGFIVGEDGLIMETHNAGSSWLRHYTGSQDRFHSSLFHLSGHAMVLGDHGAMLSMSNGHNSSWFNYKTPAPVTAIATGIRYAALLNGDILDRQTGITRHLSSDPVFSFDRSSKGQTILGAGQFGRITRLTVSDITKKVEKRR